MLIGFGAAVLIFAGFLAVAGGIGPLAVLIGAIGAVLCGWGAAMAVAMRRR